LAHGICHLIGYDHETEEEDKVMEKRENKILSKYFQNIGLPLDPYSPHSQVSDKVFKKINFLKLLSLDK
jgi:hypothetical protein